MCKWLDGTLSLGPSTMQCLGCNPAKILYSHIWWNLVLFDVGISCGCANDARRNGARTQRRSQSANGAHRCANGAQRNSAWMQRHSQSAFSTWMTNLGATRCADSRTWEAREDSRVLAEKTVGEI